MARMVMTILNKLDDAAKRMEIDPEIIRYGLKIETAFLLESAGAILLCVLFRKGGSGMIFIAVFSSLRKYCGGYHCQTLLSCALLYISAVFIITVFFPVSISVSLLGAWYLFIRCPVESSHQIISGNDRKLYQKKNRVQIIICLLAALGADALACYTVSESIGKAMLCLACLCAVQQCINGKEAA